MHLIASLWVGFISCGFETFDSEHVYNFRHTISPNFGRVYVRIEAVDYVRGYMAPPGVTCSSIHTISGDRVVVLGSLDNVLQRINDASKSTELPYSFEMRD